MKYLTYDDKTWAIDIETDGLNPTLVWVMVAGNMITNEEVVLTDMKEMTDWLEEKRADGHKFVFHNGLHFDGPVLNKMVGSKLSPSNIIDTMVLSMLYNPSLGGGHGLEAWGERANIPKLEHDDWYVFSPEMVDRCKGDVKITKWVYANLCLRLRRIGFAEKSIALEHMAWVLVRKQKINGFHFDYPRAATLRSDLIDIADELNKELQVFFPPELAMLKEYSKAYKKDGTFTKDYLNHLEVFEKLVIDAETGKYQAWGWVQFDPGSIKQRIDKLMALGWVPREYTEPSKTHPEGQPQMTRKGKLVPSLVEFVEAQEEDNGVVTLVNWMEANGRATMIRTWMEHYNEQTECIHGQLWLANTLRYKHSGPNTANIVGLKLDENEHPLKGKAGGWAYECRDLWDSRDRGTRRMVGVDAKGIQLRVLAHYLNDENFTAAILEADPHAANARMMGLPGRGIAKTITYAIVMGAGDQKIADTARISLAEAKENKKKFFDKVPGLRKLINRLKAEQKKDGRITLCDGARILCESDHTVIPYLLQGDESRIMKKAKLIADRMIREQKLDVLWVGDIHDEWQCDVLTEHVEALKAICVIAFKQAGEYFNYNLPIDCDAKVGFTWAETH